jgi:hypothetical protein
MRDSRRWFAALLVALGLLPGVERLLLAHVHHASGPAAELAAVDEHAAAGGVSGCAACQARATLGAFALDAHPERHGVAPAAPPLPRPCAAPPAPRAETPPARAPPLPIV